LPLQLWLLSGGIQFQAAAFCLRKMNIDNGKVSKLRVMPEGILVFLNVCHGYMNHDEKSQDALCKFIAPKVKHMAASLSLPTPDPYNPYLNLPALKYIQC
jgi:hypothetical protein